jgi:hypothetical protein
VSKEEVLLQIESTKRLSKAVKSNLENLCNIMHDKNDTVRKYADIADMLFDGLCKIYTSV